MENIYQYPTDGQGPSGSYSSVPQNGSEMAAMTLTPEQAASSNAGYQPIRLKPCEVCFDKATGYHFGVISCEACKACYAFTRGLYERPLYGHCRESNVGSAVIKSE